MTFWLSSTEFSGEDWSSSLVGGKAKNLHWLKKQGIQVPVFGVVTSEAFRHWREHGELPPSLLRDLGKSLKAWDAKFFAVRSSMSAEDGGEHSFAGIMESYLYVPKEEVKENIIRCFKSLNSERAKAYVKKAKIDEELEAAVIVQQMVDSEVSGVAFSRSPTGESSLSLVESCWGLCEGIVSGQLNADQYQMDRFGQLVKKRIGHKEQLFEFNPDSQKSTRLASVEDSRQKRRTLNDEQLKTLFSQLMNLENLYESPVDVEWTFSKSDPEKLTLLQIRPITMNFPELKFYVDTNLAESYPGKSSPFTGSVIPKLYKSVFKEAAELLGMGKRKLRSLDPVYEKLVEYHGGHLYYNLQSYYTALSGLPGGENNIRKWQRMVGGELNHIQVPYRKMELNFFEKLRTAFSLIKMALFHERQFKSFYQNIEQVYSREKQELAGSNNAKECVKNMVALLESPMGFGLTAANDVLIMLYLGVFESRAKAQGLSNEQIVSSLATKGEIESLRPLRELEKILEQGRDVKKFLASFEDLLSLEKYSQIFPRLESEGHKEMVHALKEYLHHYGDRAFEELKFESLSFVESPREFYRLLKFVHSSPKQYDRPNEEKTSFHLDQIQVFLLHRLHAHIAHREKSRLWRGKFYGLIRMGMLRLADFLKLEGDERQQVFSLKFDDLKSFLAGELEVFDLRERVNKNWLSYPDYFPELFCTDGEHLPYFLEKEFEESEAEDQGATLRGSGACEKKTLGKALVLTTPQQALDSDEDLSECILVTKSTDPGWVFLMSRCRGLISEKGSLLSHTAIIGRELGLATVVGVERATKRIHTGQKLELDGNTGKVSILSDETLTSE